MTARELDGRRKLRLVVHLRDSDGGAEARRLDEDRVAERVVDLVAEPDRDVWRDGDAAVAHHLLEEVLVHRRVRTPRRRRRRGARPRVSSSPCTVPCSPNGPGGSGARPRHPRASRHRTLASSDLRLQLQLATDHGYQVTYDVNITLRHHQVADVIDDSVGAGPQRQLGPFDVADRTTAENHARPPRSTTRSRTEMLLPRRPASPSPASRRSLDDDELSVSDLRSGRRCGRRRAGAPSVPTPVQPGTLASPSLTVSYLI